MIERKATGAYNAHCLPNSLTMEHFLEECKSVNGSDAEFTWISEDFLLQENVAAWSDSRFGYRKKPHHIWKASCSSVPQRRSLPV